MCTYSNIAWILLFLLAVSYQSLDSIHALTPTYCCYVTSEVENRLLNLINSSLQKTRAPHSTLQIKWKAISDNCVTDIVRIRLGQQRANIDVGRRNNCEIYTHTRILREGLLINHASLDDNYSSPKIIYYWIFIFVNSSRGTYTHSHFLTNPNPRKKMWIGIRFILFNHCLNFFIVLLHWINPNVPTRLFLHPSTPQDLKFPVSRTFYLILLQFPNIANPHLGK